MMMLPRIASLLINTPLAVLPETGRAVLAAVAGRIGVVTLDGRPLPQPDVHAAAFVGRPAQGMNGPLGYNVTDSGVAIVPVTGELANRGSHLGAPSGICSYEGLQHQMKAIWQDDQISAVVLDMHSGGGEFSGMVETAALVAKVNKRKPVYAVVNDLAASAAYCIAAAASTIVVSPFGRVGSIGILTFHADMSRAMEAQGITVSMIQAGAHKADGSPLLPLADDVREGLQAVVDRAYESFIGSVAANRPRLGDKAARATEARVYWGDEAVTAGLADAVGTLDSVLAGLGKGAIGAGGQPALTVAAVAVPPPRPVAAVAAAATEPEVALEEEADEAEIPEEPAEPEIDPHRLPNEEPEAMTSKPAPTAAVQTPAPTPAPTPAIAAEGPAARIKAILTADAAKGREALAQKLAFDTTVASAEALTILGAAPVAVDAAAVLAGAGVTRGAEPAAGPTISYREIYKARAEAAAAARPRA